MEQQEEKLSDKSNSPIGSPPDAESPSKLVTALTAAATKAVSGTLGQTYLSASVPKAANIASYLQHLQAQTKTNKNRPQNRSEKKLQGVKIGRLNSSEEKCISDEERDSIGV